MQSIQISQIFRFIHQKVSETKNIFVFITYVNCNLTNFKSLAFQYYNSSLKPRTPKTTFKVKKLYACIHTHTHTFIYINIIYIFIYICVYVLCIQQTI